MKASKLTEAQKAFNLRQGDEGTAGANMAAGDFDGPDLQRLLVDPQLGLTSDPSLGSAMLAGMPLTVARDLDALSPVCSNQ